ncbi:MAG TPA: ABC-F family ATP-binding cassette domain-containing protein [Gammaproteobacteria bacterium]|nr:ABC-F family ATP-binding cassette domain-containing protein [Gammaproteobacteria bacterium]
MASDLLVSVQSISKAYGLQTLFDGITLSFREEERLGLIGPNGSGKSTLLKILAGIETPDSGQVAMAGSTHLVYLPQEDRFPAGATVESALLEALPPYHKDEGLSSIRDRLREMDFADLNQKVDTLSGGWRKRLAVTCALIREPNLLLMDEPTNHLDLEGILWLEGLLRQARFAFVLVSHDRYFLENATNRIVELNRRYPDGYLRVEGNYSEFLQRRLAVFDQQDQQEQVLANKFRRELEWLRRGPKARTTKAHARIDAAYELKDELTATRGRNAQGARAGIEFEGSERKTRKLVELEQVAVERGGRRLFAGLDLTLGPGSCLGVLGRNGSGKSSLMQLLTGALKPSQGSINWADELKIVSFDQKREQLDKSLRLKEALSPTGDSVMFQGKPLHVTAWAKRFLFPIEKLGLPVSKLSGGEQARVLIARLMLQPADLLLLDEPTNDLDIATLEVLEDSLSEFPGACVLISHDRYLMDRLSDRLLYLDGEGHAEYFADYPQWLQVRARSTPAAAADAAPVQKKAAAPRLSREERKELDGIEKKVGRAEAEVQRLQQQMSDPAVMSDAARLKALYAEVKAAEAKVASIYARWQELEALGG